MLGGGIRAPQLSRGVRRMYPFGSGRTKPGVSAVEGPFSRRGRRYADRTDLLRRTASIDETVRRPARGRPSARKQWH